MTVIDRDTPCIDCQYNLRGLDTGGLCPECGTPVISSFHSEFLAFSDPLWIRRIQRGTGFILAGSLGLLGSITLLWILSNYVGVSPTREVLSVLSLMLAPFAACLLVGSWMLTDRGSERRPSVAGLFTVLAAAVLAASALAFSLILTVPPRYTPDWGYPLLLILTWAGAIVWLCGCTAGAAEAFGRVLMPGWAAAGHTLVVVYLLAFTLCLPLGIGPVIALISQSILLYRLRRTLSTLLLNQAT